MVNCRARSHNGLMSKLISKYQLYALGCLAFVAACTPSEPPNTTVAMLDSPAANGSMAPNLSKGHDGTTLLSWIEANGDGNALKFSLFEENSWSSPIEVTRGDNWFVNWADFPSVVAVSESLWAAHWLVSQPAGGYAYDVNIALSSDSGVTWSESFLTHKDGTPTEHGFVSLFNDADRLGAVWLDGRKTANEYDENDVRASGMTLRAGTYSYGQTESDGVLLDDLICDCCQTDVALTGSGPVAIYRNRTVDEQRDIFISRRVDGAWQKGVPVNDDAWDIAACPVNGPVIKADGQTVAAAWFTGANEEPRVKAAWSNDAGRSFAAPIEIDAEQPLGRAGSALLPGGDLVVSWLRSVGGGRANLMLKRISQQGGQSADYVVAEAPDVFAFSVPQLVSSGTDLLLVWTAETDHEYNVKSAAIPIALLPIR